MKAELQLYTRKDCCLCEEMKRVLGEVAVRIPFALDAIDIDTSPALQDEYGNDSPGAFRQREKSF
jgi:glutaredoxin-like protein DUF836